jgi:hypothetical protein
MASGRSTIGERHHAALDMRTPATLWHSSARRYDPRPVLWEYPTGSKVLKVDCQGKIDAWGCRWRIAVGLSGERVQLVRLGSSCQVYYCSTMIRELDLESQILNEKCQGYPETNCSRCPETGQKAGRCGAPCKHHRQKHRERPNIRRSLCFPRYYRRTTA